MNTKTDRELIELAAKAAGYKEFKYEDMRGWGEARYGLSEAIFISDIEDYWNPLVDNGDAFGLMAALGLTPHFYSDQGTTLIVVDDIKNPEGCDVIVRWNGDMLSATRRSIVMAAAKIGEGME